MQLRAQPENDADGHREGCLCVACHLSGTVFPRRQDGRIVLPVPWLIRSNLERGKFWSHVPDVEEATRRDECESIGLLFLFFAFFCLSSVGCS